MRRTARAHSPDYILLGTTAVLVLGGILALASASLVLSSVRFDNSYYYVTHQLVYGIGIGAIAFMAGWRIRYTVWKRFAVPLLIVSLCLMALVFVPGIGEELKGAKRWITLGPLSLQPAELLKLSYIIYLASWMESKKKHIGGFKEGFLPFLVMLGFISVFFILQPDIGTLGVLAVSSVLLFFIGGGRLNQVGLLLITGLIIFGVLVYLQPYRMERFTTFLNPTIDPQGISYQINQALIALGSGGVWGKGFGFSQQKVNYLPESYGDSIFAIVGEEFGFIGTTTLIILFLLLFWRGFSVSRRAPDGFAKFLAAGITSLILVQTFTNIAAISGLIPLTGIPLPFISYGSSALTANLASIGILMNISKYTL